MKLAKISIFALLVITILGISSISDSAFAQKNNGNNAGGLPALAAIVDALSAAVDNAIANLSALISEETNARIAADETLQTNIDTIELTPGPQGEQGIQGEPGQDGTGGLSCENQNAIAAVIPDFVVDESCPQLEEVNFRITAANTIIRTEGEPINAGENTKYTMGFWNRGPGDATNVVITGVFSSIHEIISISPPAGAACTFDATSYSCNVGTILSNVSNGILVNLSTAPTDGTSTYSVTVTGDFIELDPSDNTAVSTHPVVSQQVDCTNLTPGANLSGCDFFQQNLNYLDLSGADFSGANLQEAQLSYADFSGANFDGANLNGIQGGQANFSGASFVGADVSIAALGQANLSNADFTNANLSDAYFNGANFSGIILNGADLTDALLRGVDLVGVDFTNTNLQDADRRGEPYIGCIGHFKCV